MQSKDSKEEKHEVIYLGEHKHLRSLEFGGLSKDGTISQNNTKDLDVGVKNSHLIPKEMGNHQVIWYRKVK